MSHKELMKEINQLPPAEKQSLLEISLGSWRGWLYRHVFSWTQNETQAEEIVQETFLFLFRHIEQIQEHQIQSFSAFLLKLARHSFDSMQRRQRKDGSDISNQESDALESSDLDQGSHSKVVQKTLSQRLYGILKFDGDPPNDEEVKDLIADYLIRKYS